MKNENILFGDVGGTHVRLAWATDNAISTPETLYAAKFRRLEDAVRHFLGTQQRKPAAAAFSIAGIVLDGHASMTNLDWEMSEAGLARALGLTRVRIVNDFTAAALGIPPLKASELTKIGGGNLRADAPKAVIGPGTGLGVGGLVPDGRGGFIPLSGEGGHVDLAASNARELAVLEFLLRDGKHVSAEHVLSGGGLENLYRILAAIDGEKAPPLTASEIDAAARHGEPRAKETVTLFTGWLGAVAGDLALTLGAHGGVYLAGGILPRWGALFDAKLFRARFEDKGRMKDFLAPIPVFLILADDLALRGLAALMRDTH
jgi:glucokinase